MDSMGHARAQVEREREAMSPKSAAFIMMSMVQLHRRRWMGHSELEDADLLMGISRGRKRRSSPWSARDEDAADEDVASHRELLGSSTMGPCPRGALRTGNKGVPTPPHSNRRATKCAMGQGFVRRRSGDINLYSPEQTPDFDTDSEQIDPVVVPKRLAPRKSREALPKSQQREEEKRPHTRNRDKEKSPREIFGAYAKLAISRWEEQNTTPTQGRNAGEPSNRLRDEARRLLPPDGPGTPLHYAEIALAANAGFTMEHYYSLKYRSILGDAAFVEQNFRIAALETRNVATMTGRGPFWNFSLAHAQMCSNRDVCRLKSLFDAWKAWGWIPDMFAPDGRTLNPQLATRFPADIRRSLMADIERFEDVVVPRGLDYPVVKRLRLQAVQS